MLKDIHSKLGDILRQASYSEPDVVYIFVEIRKILEKTGEGDKYSSINFYADWVVHSELMGRRAYERLKKLEKIFTEKKTLYIDIPVIDKAKDFISFLELKKEMSDFLTANNLPIDIKEKSKWSIFLNNLLNVLSDCPLRMREEKTLIKEFVFKPQLTSDDVVFEIYLNNGLCFSGTTNFTYLENL